MRLALIEPPSSKNEAKQERRRGKSERSRVRCGFTACDPLCGSQRADCDVVSLQGAGYEDGALLPGTSLGAISSGSGVLRRYPVLVFSGPWLQRRRKVTHQPLPAPRKPTTGLKPDAVYGIPKTCLLPGCDKPVRVSRNGIPGDFCSTECKNECHVQADRFGIDRKSTRLNSS